MALKRKRNPASAHARETASTPPPFSSSIAAWVDQLPTPPPVTLHLTDGWHTFGRANHDPQFQHLPSTSKHLNSISSNVQRLPRAHEPTTSGKSRKRRAVSPLPHNQPQRRKAFTSADCPKRRSARVASLRSKVNRSANRTPYSVLINVHSSTNALKKRWIHRRTDTPWLREAVPSRH